MESESGGVVGDGSWVSYAERRPERTGPYLWRVPSKAVPGVIVTCVAHMRKRVSGYEDTISPVFDHWDGYRVHVPDGVEWKDDHSGTKTEWHKITGIDVEGVENVSCPYCGNVPTWKAYAMHPGGGCIVNAGPHQLNDWALQCCAWGKTPSFNDPRKLAEIRNAALLEAR